MIVSAPKLDVQIKQGDSNVLLVELLDSRSISQKEATFCLLDQRTFECKWSTVQALAGYKTSGHKIELFYFLCNSWLDRALAAVKKREILTDWWGNEGWEKLRKFTGDQRAEHLSKRFRDELGYQFVVPWPIYQRKSGGGVVMYYMIHATDHPAATALMARAYNKAVHPKESAKQLSLEVAPIIRQSEGALQ